MMRPRLRWVPGATVPGTYPEKAGPLVPARPPLKRFALLFLTAGAILITSACGGATEATESTSASSSATATTASPSAAEASTPSPSTTEPAQSRAAKNLALLNEDGVEASGKLMENRHGTYPRLQLTADSPLATKPANWEGPLPEGWTEADADAAATFFVNFLIQEIYDGPVNGDYGQMDAWIERNSSLFFSEFRQEMLGNLKKGGHEGIVFTNNWQETYSPYMEDGYAYIYDGKTPRMRDFNLKPTRSQIAAHPRAAYFEYEGSVVMDAQSNAGRYTEKMDIHSAAGSIFKEDDGFAIGGLQIENFANPPILAEAAEK